MTTEKAKQVVRNLGDNSHSDAEKLEAISEISRANSTDIDSESLLASIRFLLGESRWRPYMQNKNGSLILCRPTHPGKVLVTDCCEVWVARLVAFKPTDDLKDKAEPDGNIYGWDTGKEIISPYKTMWMEIPRI